MTSDPSQGTRFARILAETTYGATIDNALPRATGILAQIGRIGNQQGFVEQLKSARAQMAALIERTIQQPSELTAALGPAIWIANSQALVINLNTVEADQLAALDGLFAEYAQKIQAERDAHGPYRDLSDLAQRADLTEAIVAKIYAMADTAVTLGAYARL